MENRNCQLLLKFSNLNEEKVNKACEKAFVRYQEEVEVFNRIGKALTSNLDIKTVLKKIMEQISDLFKPYRWSLMLLDERCNELYFEVFVGREESKIKPLRLRLGEGVSGWVAQTGRPLVLPNITEKEIFKSKVYKKLNLYHNPVACVPLKVRKKVLGVIELILHPEAKPFNDHDLMILSTLADYAAISMENARMYKKIHEISIIDDVSGLYNSRYMHDILTMELDRAKRYNMPVSLIFMDLDYFKNVNDTFGHLVGSRLLRELGDLLKENTRKVDFLFRYGGDEFVIVLPNTRKRSAFRVADRLREIISEKVFLREEGLDIQITSSFGVSSFPEDALKKDELIRQGDEAMYLVKNSNRNGVQVA